MSVIELTSLPAYFKALVDEAVRRHKFDINEATSSYVVNLLHEFSRAEELFRDQTPAMALQFLEANQEISPEKRFSLLKRVGDVSLYTSGFFSDSLNRKMFDVDYYAQLGGRAYYSLASVVRDETFSHLYKELARKFYQLIDLLSAVSAGQALTNDSDVLRTYERWLRTGSRHLHERLIEQGIHPVAPGHVPAADDDDQKH